MKFIAVNLKRFDIPKKRGGVNTIAPTELWAKTIVEKIDNSLERYRGDDVNFSFFFPEAHLIHAVQSRKNNSLITIGSQSVYRSDTSIGGNFGAFTTNLTANAAVSIGCGTTIIGHCEERKDYDEVLSAAGIHDTAAVNRLLNASALRASEAGMKVLYCIGEKSEEQSRWKEVLEQQITYGLKGVDMESICIAYEPVWAIGPGKTPPNKEYIQKVARFIKEITGGANVLYGGGLKEENANMLASIEEVDGGLIALTQFTGEIGFYPDGYLKIVETYLKK